MVAKKQATYKPPIDIMVGDVFGEQAAKIISTPIFNSITGTLFHILYGLKDNHLVLVLIVNKTFDPSTAVSLIDKVLEESTSKFEVAYDNGIKLSKQQRNLEEIEDLYTHRLSSSGNIELGPVAVKDGRQKVVDYALKHLIEKIAGYMCQEYINHFTSQLPNLFLDDIVEVQRNLLMEFDRTFGACFVKKYGISPDYKEPIEKDLTRRAKIADFICNIIGGITLIPDIPELKIRVTLPGVNQDFFNPDAVSEYEQKHGAFPRIEVLRFNPDYDPKGFRSTSIGIIYGGETVRG